MTRNSDAAYRLREVPSEKLEDRVIRETLESLGAKRVTQTTIDGVRDLVRDFQEEAIEPEQNETIAYATAIPGPRRVRRFSISFTSDADIPAAIAKSRELLDAIERSGLEQFDLPYEIIRPDGELVQLLDPNGNRKIDDISYMHGMWDVYEMNER